MKFLIILSTLISKQIPMTQLFNFLVLGNYLGQLEIRLIRIISKDANLHSQAGQVVIILVMILLVALTIGLTVTQRSLTHITTSNQSEQSSRAFSAAEAGLEQAIGQTGDSVSFSGFENLALGNLGNEASATVKGSGFLPKPNQALEYPPVGKEYVAQFWLADPETTYCANPPCSYYTQPSVDVYFGLANASSGDLPALEINLITRDLGNNYRSTPYYIDTSNASGRATSGGNGFTLCPQLNPGPIFTSNSPDPNAIQPDRAFKCFVNLAFPVNSVPIMVRARILYSNASQPIAVKPTGTGSLPPQAAIYTSTGTAGQSQKTIQNFRLKYVVPPFFDYAVFSAGDINK